ncbi:MAG: hypothetical protein ABIZ80_00745 [Bryobacteraceae bacterium]
MTFADGIFVAGSVSLTGVGLAKEDAMKIARSLAVFLCAAGAALGLATIKALLVSGLGTLTPVKALVLAA